MNKDMTLPSKKRRLFGDPRVGRRGKGIGQWEGITSLQSLIYGFGMLFLIVGIIVGVVGIIISFSTLTILSWWWLSPVLVAIGFIMKLIGTKADPNNNRQKK